MRRANGEHTEVCSPLGSCSRCIVGIGQGCVTCKNKRTIEFKDKFVVLPGSAETPILGIKSIKKMDLVGENMTLFRTEEAMARHQPPIATRDDEVIPPIRTREPNAPDKTSMTGDVNGDGGDEKGRGRPQKGETESDEGKAAGPHEKGTPGAMKSRRISEREDRRGGEEMIPRDVAKSHRRRFSGVKRKLRDLQQRSRYPEGI